MLESIGIQSDHRTAAFSSPERKDMTMADYVDEGSAAACAAAADIGYATQTVEGFEPQKIEWSRWEPFYVRTANDGWYVGDRRKPVGNPFHFVCRCATEDEAIRCCLQWNRGIHVQPTDAK